MRSGRSRSGRILPLSRRSARTARPDRRSEGGTRKSDRGRPGRVRHIRPRASAVIPVGRPRPPARRSAQGGVGGMTASRRLAAVLATDVAGYSRQSAALRTPRSENQRTSSPHRQDHGRRHAGGIRERRRCAGRSRCSRQCPAEHWCRGSQRRKGRWIWSEALLI